MVNTNCMCGDTNSLQYNTGYICNNIWILTSQARYSPSRTFASHGQMPIQLDNVECEDSRRHIASNECNFSQLQLIHWVTPYKLLSTYKRKKEKKRVNVSFGSRTYMSTAQLYLRCFWQSGTLSAQSHAFNCSLYNNENGHCCKVAVPFQHCQ